MAEQVEDSQLQTSQDPDIDVKAIMEQIRRDVQEKYRSGFYSPHLLERAPSTPLGPLGGSLKSLAYLRIEGEPITSHRPMLGRLIKPWKKFMRFWTRRYTDPLFMQQSYFNSEVAGAVEQLKAEVERLQGEVDQLRSTQSNGR